MVEIQIKSVFGNVLFKCKKEDNTIKKALEEAVIVGANLRSANLYGADLGGADLRSANLGGADLGGANLYGANLGGADLRSANLRGADLRSANLGGADLGGANLYGANLRSANLYGANLGDWGEISSNSDVLILGPIGSRTDYTTIYHTDKGIFIRCGCFSGTIDEFIARVKETHKGNIHERNYLALVEFAKIKFSDAKKTNP